jgi:hypothetical protein
MNGGIENYSSSPQEVSILKMFGDPSIFAQDSTI